MAEYNKPKLTPVFANLKSAIQVWWKNLRLFIMVYLWGALYAAIATAAAIIIFGLGYWIGFKTDQQAISWVLYAMGGLAMLVSIYFWIRAYMGTFLAVKKSFIGQPRDIFNETKDFFWDYLWVAVLTAAIVFLLCLLLIIPGLIYGILFSLSVYVFFFEGKKGMAALSRSHELVKGYWWAVFGRLVLIGFLSWLFISLISAPLSANSDSIFSIVWNVIVQVISYLIGPIIMIYTYNIYQDLVRIKR